MGEMGKQKAGCCQSPLSLTSIKCFHTVGLAPTTHYHRELAELLDEVIRIIKYTSPGSIEGPAMGTLGVLIFFQ